MDKEELHSRVGQEIRSCHRWAYRTGQWATITAVVPYGNDGSDLWRVVWPDRDTDVWVPDDEMANYEFRDNRDELVTLLRNEVGDQHYAEHLAGVLRQAGYEKVTPKCTCGELLRDPSSTCGLHPDVKVRTFDQRMDFEQAFDANIEKDTRS